MHKHISISQGPNVEGCLAVKIDHNSKVNQNNAMLMLYILSRILLSRGLVPGVQYRKGGLVHGEEGFTG